MSRELFKEYRSQREAQDVAAKTLQIVYQFPTAQEAWSNLMLPVVMEGGYSNVDQLLNNVYREFSMNPFNWFGSTDHAKARKQPYIPRAARPNQGELAPTQTLDRQYAPYNVMHNQWSRERGDPLSGDTRKDHMGNPMMTTSSPESNRLMPRHELISKQLDSDQAKRQHSAEDDAGAMNKQSALKQIQWLKANEKSHKDALETVKRMAGDLVQQLTKTMDSKNPPCDMEPGVEVLKQFVGVIQKAISQFSPIYDNNKYHRQALANQQVTLPGEAKRGRAPGSGDYATDYNARQSVGDMQGNEILNRNAADLGRQRQFRGDWDTEPASTGYRQRAVRRPMARSAMGQPDMAATGTAG